MGGSDIVGFANWYKILHCPCATCGIQHLDMLALHSLVGFLTLSSCSAKLAWKDTNFLMTFGDSYTTDGMSLLFPMSELKFTNVEVSIFRQELTRLCRVSCVLVLKVHIFFDFIWTVDFV